MNIVIIDDDPFVCTSLKTILQADPAIHVAGTGTSASDAKTLCRSLNPDILLMDIQMPGESGLEAAETILHHQPDMKILFLTTFSDDAYIVKALQIGAKGYLIKQEIENIPPALKAVMSGQSVFGNEIVSKLPTLMNCHPKPSLENSGLLPREIKITELVAQGLNNREIADILYLSEGTVRNYLSTILDKLNLRDRTQLAVFYLHRR